MEKRKQPVTLRNIQDAVRDKIIFWWLTHCYLRQIAKRYPDHFKDIVKDITDNAICRRIMLERYASDPQKKFEAIAIDMKMDLRNVFAYHKKVIDKIIKG